MFFEYPGLLYLELILIPLIALHIWREIRGASPSLRVASTAPWMGSGGKMKKMMRHLPFVAR